MIANHLERFDRFSIICSSACALHCVLLPVTLLFFPTLTFFIGSEWIHLGLLILVIPVSVFSFVRNKKIHKEAAPLKFGILGILLLVAAVLNEHFLGVEIRGFEQVVTVAGSVVLIAAHILNIKYLRHRSKK